MFVAACGGRDEDPQTHFCSQSHLALKNPSVPGLCQAGLSPSRSGFGGHLPFPPCPPSKAGSRIQAHQGWSCSWPPLGGKKNPIFIISVMGITTTLKPEGSSGHLGTVMCLLQPTATTSLVARAVPTAAVTLPAPTPAVPKQQRPSGDPSWSCPRAVTPTAPRTASSSCRGERVVTAPWHCQTLLR